MSTCTIPSQKVTRSFSGSSSDPAHLRNPSYVCASGGISNTFGSPKVQVGRSRRDRFASAVPIAIRLSKRHPRHSNQLLRQLPLALFLDDLFQLRRHLGDAFQANLHL